eukprot:m.96327 g.96327  ORF g.96327 m.96327 type:complete len:165 (-) comp12462_c0_seq1:1092-1586(-)
MTATSSPLCSSGSFISSSNVCVYVCVYFQFLFLHVVFLFISPGTSSCIECIYVFIIKYKLLSQMNMNEEVNELCMCMCAYAMLDAVSLPILRVNSNKCNINLRMFGSVALRSSTPMPWCSNICCMLLFRQCIPTSNCIFGERGVSGSICGLSPVISSVIDDFEP